MKAFLDTGNFSSEKVNVRISGSKSESNRLLLLKAQFPQLSIENLSNSDDTAVLQKGLKVGEGTVDVHHAGTAMRFLTAYFASKPNTEIILTGSERMQQRPIGILVDALRRLGADIEFLKNKDFPPLKIKGKQLQKNEIVIQADVSSQYISALMLIAPTLSKGLKIILEGKITSEPYIEMTVSLLNKIGINAVFSENHIQIPPIQNIEKTTIAVESDWSSASYFYSLAALSKKTEITLGNFCENSLQGDCALISIYEALGVKTVFNSSENTITLSKQNVELPDSLLLDLSNTPDLAQTIVVSCFGLGISCKLTGLHTLKIKETDRLIALQHELQKFGAVVIVDKESLKLEKAKSIKSGVAVETYNDHRMAMAFAPLAIKTQLVIDDAEVVSKSYPGFWEDLQKTGIFVKFIG